MRRYGKFVLDARSHAFVTKHIERIPDTLLRQQLWRSLYETVSSKLAAVLDISCCRYAMLSRHFSCGLLVE